MFKLVILVSLFVNGHPASNGMKIMSKQIFSTQDECKAYPKTPAGTAQIKALAALLTTAAPKGQSAKIVGMGCEKTEEETI